MHALKSISFKLIGPVLFLTSKIKLTVAFTPYDIADAMPVCAYMYIFQFSCEKLCGSNLNAYLTVFKNKW